MSDAVATDGAAYISTGEAASRTGLGRDYIASFCRDGKIRGRQDGKNWFVDPQSLDAFLAEQEVIKQKRNADLATELREASERGAAAQNDDAVRELLASAITHRAPQSLHEQNARRAAAETLWRFSSVALATIVVIGSVAVFSSSARALAMQSLGNISAITASAAAALYADAQQLPAHLASAFHLLLASSSGAGSNFTYVRPPANQEAAAALAATSAAERENPATSSTRTTQQLPNLSSVPYSATAQQSPGAAGTVAATNAATNSVSPASDGRVLGASTSALDTVTDSELDAALNALRTQFWSALSFSGPAASTPISTASFAPSQRIDQLNNTTLSNITVSGVSGLTAADIPTNITASNYLPLSGGTLSGTLTTPALTVTGASSFANSDNFFGPTSFGATGTTTISAAGTITTPAIIATNATAASLTAYAATFGAATATSTFAVYGTASFGSSATSTFGTNGALTIPSTLAVYGTSSFGSSATTTIDAGGNLTVAGNLTVSGAQTLSGAITVPYLNATSTSVASSFQNASSTLLSVFRGAYFGATATSSFSSTGALTLASALGVSSGGTGTTTWQTGSIPFFNGTLLTEDNSNFFWDATNHRLGIGTASPVFVLDVQTLVPNTRAISGANSATTGTNYGVLGKANGSGADNNTGLYATASGGTNNYGLRIAAPAVSANNWAIYSDATAQSYLAGNLGIGQTSPTYKLDVTGLGHFTGLVDAANFVATSTATSTFSAIGSASGNFTLGSAGTTNNILLNPYGGNVGIGTTNPLKLLSVQATSTQNQDVFVVNNGNGTAKAIIGLGTGSGQIQLKDSNNNFNVLFNAGAISYINGGNVGIGTTTPDAHLTIASGNSTSEFTNLHIVNTNATVGARTAAFEILDNSVRNGATIMSSLENQVTGAAGQSDMVFYNNTGGGITEKMRLTSTGNLGIGTSSPTAKLEVYDNTNGGILKLSRDAGQLRGQLQFGQSGSSLITGQISNSADTGSVNNGFLAFSASNGSGVLTEYMRILGANGNVGIGTTSPAALLSVAGNAYVTGGFGIGAVAAVPGGVTISRTGNNPFFLFQQDGSAVGQLRADGTLGNINIADSSGGTPYLSVRTIGTGAGNVGIGQTSPTYNLDVTGLGHFTGLVDAANFVATSSSVASSIAYRLGIGTTNPGSQLDIQGGAGTIARFLVFGSTNGVIISTTTNNYVNLRVVDGGARNINIVTNPNDLTTSDAYLAAVASGLGSGVSLSTRVDADNNYMALRARGDIALYTNSGSTALNERMRITSAGNVGIGTTTPGTKLSVVGSSLLNGNYPTIQIDSAGGAGGAEVGMQFTYQGAKKWYLVSRADAPVDRLGIYGSTGGEVFSILQGGNVGIGTTSPDMLLSVGSASPVGNVAHFENSTGSCYINPTTTSLSCSSDARLKTNVAAIDASSTLAALLALNPVTYNWLTEATGTPAHGGFIAQQVLPILPDLVSKGPDGYYTLNYAGFTPYLVKALQEIASISGAFKANLIAWLADADNGIGDLFARNVYATNGTFHQVISQQDTTQELCITESVSDPNPVCVTKAQLAALLSAAATPATTESVSSPASNPRDASPQNPSPDLTNSGNPDNANSSSPASSAALVVNGNNPATWQQNSPWHDNLGALFTHDGNAETIYSTSTVDTTQSGTTTTLDYWALVPSTQQWLHATRGVIVNAAAASPSTPPAPAASSTPDATSSLPAIDAPPLVPDYPATTTIPTATSSAQ